jgi:hypothetical protein
MRWKESKMQEDLSGEAGSRQKRPAISVDLVSDPVEILDDDTESDGHDEKKDSPPPSSGLLDLHAAATAADVMNPIPYPIAMECFLHHRAMAAKALVEIGHLNPLCTVESALARALNPKP